MIGHGSDKNLNEIQYLHFSKEIFWYWIYWIYCEDVVWQLYPHDTTGEQLQTLWRQLESDADKNIFWDNFLFPLSQIIENSIVQKNRHSRDILIWICCSEQNEAISIMLLSKKWKGLWVGSTKIHHAFQPQDWVRPPLMKHFKTGIFFKDQQSTAEKMSSSVSFVSPGAFVNGSENCRTTLSHLVETPS